MRESAGRQAKHNLFSLKALGKDLTDEQLGFLRYLNESRLFVVNKTAFELVRPVPEYLMAGAHFSHLRAFIGKNCDVRQLSVFQKMALLYFTSHKVEVGKKKRCDSVTFGLSGLRVEQVKSQERINARSLSAPTLPIPIPRAFGFERQPLTPSSSEAVSFSLRSGGSPGPKPARGFFKLPAAGAKRPSKFSESKKETVFSDGEDGLMFRFES